MEVYVNKASTIVNYNFINSDSRVPKYSTTTNDPINAGMLFLVPTCTSYILLSTFKK